jgi:hypothetical protein
MALSGITFKRGTAGLGRPLPGVDHISGMVFYIDDAELPVGFTPSIREAKIFSLSEAEDLGIRDTNLGEILATGTVTITAVGTDGNTIEIKVVEYDKTVSLGTYTKAAGDTTVTNVAAAIVLIVNAGTLTHGYSASNAAGVITIISRSGLGVFLNTGTPLQTTILGAITATVAQFGAGALIDGKDSAIDTVHYHVSEFFRIQPQGVLYIGIYDTPASAGFTEINNLIDFAQGEIKQLGIYIPGTALTAAVVTAIDAILMAKALEDKPCSAVLTADFKSTALSALPTLANNSDYRVSVDIAQDGAAKGYQLFRASGKTVGCMGAMLGVISLSSVNECIGSVGRFNMSDGVELETIAFGNGAIYKTQSLSLLSTLNDYKYNFLRKRAVSGTYWENSNTSITNTSDFSRIENVRTVDKAIRLTKQNCEIKINSTLLLNTNGTLSEDTIADFLRLANIGLDDMLRRNEVSAYATFMESNQNVLSTSKVALSIKIVPTGVARQIEFNVGLSTSI